MSGRVDIGGGALTAVIDPKGAELWSLRDAEGRELMTDADPGFWAGHAPVLFPLVGAQNGGKVRIGGRKWPTGKHGFARELPFDLVARDADSATFRLTDGPDTAARWPFRFTLDLTYRIAGATLSTLAAVTNDDETPMPFSFGFHPAFAWPLPGAGPAEAHVVRFDRDEPGPVRRIDPATGLLLPDAFATPVAGDTLIPTPDLFVPDALIWDRLESRAATWGVPGVRALRIAFPDLPMLGIWQKPHARFLCIEPWAGIADPAGFDGDIADKPGIMMLPPGATRSFAMDVTLVDGDGRPS